MTNDEEAANSRYRLCPVGFGSQTTLYIEKREIEAFLAGCAHARSELESKLAEAVKYLKRIATNFDCSAGRDCESRQEYKCESCIAREALERIEGKE